ncbi:MAG: class I SAM-dependent methyltransferase [Candidatus Eiseniibacteriota bacterium]|nr:MAG: class I SAM-dependent methyltransferase [Candidatus Eisenbacteria bacterium]
MRESTREHWRNYWVTYADADELYSTEGRIIEQLSAVSPIRRQRVLEVGAGSGRDSVALVRLGGEVFVLDYVQSSLGVIRAAAETAGVRAHLVCADATRMPFRGESFDIVFHQGLMEHFRDPSGLLHENRRVLKKQGVLLVDVPQRYHIYTVVKHALIFVGKWFAGWETEYTVGSLEKLVTSHGFRVERSYGDWMVPGFFYRGLRYVLRKLSITVLPKYPEGIPMLRRAAEGFRSWFRKKRLAFYTFAVIGTVARKE